ncbi:MAG: hypothetical protein C4B58_13280 [Deltaproteobacteria bacterium]|nr:MAG: hypothetical protein C4B58_13280 [Deltaproteobacteria bacterium]
MITRCSLLTAIWIFGELPTLDILEDVYRRLGYRLSLDHLASVTLGAQKTANGMQALKWWKQGKIKEILKYCNKDVAITRDLFLYGYKKAIYFLRTKQGKQSGFQWTGGIIF